MSDQPEVVFDLEATFKAILEQPDSVVPAEEIADDGEFTDEQRATLQAALQAHMLSPEEIMQRAECAAHNAEVHRKREEKQAKKRARRELGLNPKRCRSR